MYVISEKMNRFSWLPRVKKEQKKNHKKTTSKKNKRKILVISWWGFRWTYALGILKAIEENNVDQEIDAVYWVSIWAIIWSLRTYWIKSEKIFEILSSVTIGDFYGTDVLKISWWLASNKKFSKMIDQYLPQNFEDLQVPLYIWTVDTNSAEFQLFSTWELRKPVLWSMSIPWIFPPVKFQDFSLIDWWVLNNFPVDIAKKHYPNHEIIWIALNKFQTNQKVKSAIDNLLVTFQVMMRSKLLENTKKVDYLFYRDLPINVLTLNKKQMREAFALWYEDWCRMFSKTNS